MGKILKISVNLIKEWEIILKSGLQPRKVELKSLIKRNIPLIRSFLIKSYQTL